MSELVQPKPGLGSAVKGFVTGLACAVVLFGLIRLIMVGGAATSEWRGILFMSLLVGALFAIGQGVAGHVGGAVAGGLVGVLLGGALGATLPPWLVTYPMDDKVAGAVFDLSGPGLDGEPIDAADYRGKVLLVDFWATWCGPCLHEMPNVVAAYDKYHNQGFEVLGVSLDNDREDLQAFLKSKKLPWKQIFFEESGKSGWQNPLVRQHRVQGIPATFLLDREGRLAATGLRGHDLDLEVARLLGPAGMGLANLTPHASMAGFALLFALVGAIWQRAQGIPRTTP